MSFPETLAALEAAGYKHVSYSRCVGCKAAIEWWTTPNDRPIPMDPMAQPDSPALAHFATCPEVAKFKKRKPGAYRKKP
jgi:hypothetical protein